MDKIRYKSILEGDCIADHKVGPTVEMRGLQERQATCPECEDRGWVIVSKVREATSGGVPDVMPCRICEPAQLRRWENGCIAGNNAHCQCDECVGIRAGTIGRSDYAPDGTLLVCGPM
jgi:hypothetical protein